ncbi:MAG TPA: single-stranded DNA-binding protein [Candidatus Coprenecus stercoravium]|uniref:Single-stranded DNA-binding protein n=1 Tax=Candidatus Coprenecus stercoravium TaxID=2840735 RepID=A0A9D2K878_9BACT|nr:single-stranded DNA-binding protein [Candidatus Coprenecus stercoravium]
MSLNKVLLIGNAGRDPEVRHLESGAMTATFSLATTERYRDRSTGEPREQTEWHNIVCWRNLAEIAEKYVRKGTQLFIEGRIRTRSYNDKDGNTKYVTEIVADNFQLLGRKSDNPATPVQSGRPAQAPSYQQSYNTPQYSAPAQPAQTAPADVQNDEIGDDLPF